MIDGEAFVSAGTGAVFAAPVVSSPIRFCPADVFPTDGQTPDSFYYGSIGDHDEVVALWCVATD